MNQVAKATGGLPANLADYASKLQTGIADSRASTVIAGGGKPLLRLLKSGEWVFGASNEEVQEGSSWAVNVLSLAHGWSCWVEGEGNQKNELKGEILVSMTEPKPVRPPPIQGFDYAEVRAFELKCMDGDDEGTEVLHKTSSVGGMRAVDALLAAIYKQLSEAPQFSCPVIYLDVDSYNHTKWGKIFTPVFEIADWCDLEGNMMPEGAAGQVTDQSGGQANGHAPEPEPQQQAQQTRAQPQAEANGKGKGKKAPLNAAGKDAGKGKGKAAEPAPTAAARGGQRRRPGR